MSRTAYEKDVVLWAQEQARLLRAGQFSELDIEHLADEIEDVGKSEQRELANRMAVLLAHLLKWRFQPAFRGGSRRRTIDEQRKGVALRIERTPSLKAMLPDPGWRSEIWSEAVTQAIAETGVEALPGSCPWTMEQVMDPDFWPDEAV